MNICSFFTRLLQSLANVNRWFECRTNIAANGTHFYWSSSMFVFLLHCCLWLFGKVHTFETDGRAKHLHGFSRRDRGIWEWDDLGAKTQLGKVLHPTGISHQKTHARVAPFGVVLKAFPWLLTISCWLHIASRAVDSSVEFTANGLLKS